MPKNKGGGGKGKGAEGGGDSGKQAKGGNSVKVTRKNFYFLIILLHLQKCGGS